MSTVEFEIDELQTWLFEMQLKECYIERQHTVTDNKIRAYRTRKYRLWKHDYS